LVDILITNYKKYIWRENMSFSLKGKVALITGANRGIGKAIVDEFIAQGASKVYLAIRDLNNAKPLVDLYGDKVEAAYLNLDDPESIENLAKAAQDVEIIVNNAGVLMPSELFSENFEQSFNAELKVNTFGLLRIAKAFDTILRAKKKAAFVQLNSVGSIKNFDGLTSYCASKAASYTITQALKSYWIDSGIQVVSVHPGPIATDMAKQGGMYEVATPSSVVADTIVQSLANNEFHLFPDVIAQEMSVSYRDFAKGVVEAEVVTEEA